MILWHCNVISAVLCYSAELEKWHCKLLLLHFWGLDYTKCQALVSYWVSMSWEYLKYVFSVYNQALCIQKEKKDNNTEGLRWDAIY